MYSFVLPGGEIHPHDRVDAGGPPTCVDYRHAGGRENLPSTGKVVGSKERKIVSRLFVKNNMLICWFFFFFCQHHQYVTAMKIYQQQMFV